MAALVVPEGGYVRLGWTYNSGTINGYNVIGCRIPAGTTITQALADAISTAIKNAVTSSGLAPTLSSATALAAVGVRDLRTANMPEFVGAGAAVSGTGAGDALPRSVALVVTLRTASAGPRNRGRVYLGGFDEGANGPGGNPSAALITAAPAFINAVGSAMTAQGLTLAVLSRPANQITFTKDELLPSGQHNITTKVQQARAGKATAVTAVVLRNSIWDSQRRRTSAGSVSTFSMQDLVRLEIA